MKAAGALISFITCLVIATPARAQIFRRPLTCDDCVLYWYYFDHVGSGVQDWNCDSSSYNGHRGTDYSLIGGNDAIDDGYTVVAAADGVVQLAEDGHFDHCTACDEPGCGMDYGDGFGNYLVIIHGDYDVVYAHLRTGSVRFAPGDRVTCGDVIGQIGSSGCSNGAHLHFEVRPHGGSVSDAFDPFAGLCSPTIPSLWIDQGPYRGLPDVDCDGLPTCPESILAEWFCINGGASRRRCIDADDEIEDCPWGCEVNPSGDDRCLGPPDEDGDSYTADVDCDDDDMNTHPGAPEVCGDGLDQDCNGADDPCPPIPPDRDDDGYAANVDCDDWNPTRYPGAPEICDDGIDQDCNSADTLCSEGDSDGDSDEPLYGVIDGGVLPVSLYDRNLGIQGACQCLSTPHGGGLVAAILALLRSP